MGTVGPWLLSQRHMYSIMFGNGHGLPMTTQPGAHIFDHGYRIPGMGVGRSWLFGQGAQIFGHLYWQSIITGNGHGPIMSGVGDVYLPPAMPWCGHGEVMVVH